MRLRKIVALCCACLLLCGAVTVAAADGENCDFEYGNTDGWQAFDGVSVSADAAYTGEYGCLLTGDGGWDDLLYRTFSVVPGRTYTLSFWYCAQGMGVSWYIYDGGVNGVRLCRGWADTERWTKVTQHFTPSTDTVCLLYRCSGSNLPERVYLDDVQVSVKECAVHLYDADCDIYCNACGSIRQTQTDHVYSYACATRCGGCGALRSTETDHVYDYVCDAYCNVCDEQRTVAHSYDDDYDAVCNVCSDVRIPAPRPVKRLSSGGAAISYEVDGVCFRFFLEAEQAATRRDYSYVTKSATVYPFDNGTAYSLVRMGAVISNEANPTMDLEHLTTRTIDVKAGYLCKNTGATVSYAVRIINIPQQGRDTTIFARPYYVYSDGTTECVVYGETVSRAFNELVIDE